MYVYIYMYIYIYIDRYAHTHCTGTVTVPSNDRFLTVTRSYFIGMLWVATCTACGSLNGCIGSGRFNVIGCVCVTLAAQGLLNWL